MYGLHGVNIGVPLLTLPVVTRMLEVLRREP